MLKTPLQLIVSILTFGLFVATLILYIQEGQIYVDDEEKFWKQESWTFWPKRTTKVIQLLLIILISLPLAGCSVFNDDEYVDDKPWSRPADWENQGLQLPGGI